MENLDNVYTWGTLSIHAQNRLLDMSFNVQIVDLNCFVLNCFVPNCFVTIPSLISHYITPS